MKRIFYLICIVCLFGQSGFAQEGQPGHHNARKRLDELEKLKLMEILNLDEEKMVKFFSKRSEFSDRVNNLYSQKNQKLNQIEKSLEGTDKNDASFKRLNNEILEIEEDIVKAKVDYISSLNSVLSHEQISKVILFERNFKRELRTLIFNERRGKRQGKSVSDTK
ncbi:MAG: hypothetical protein ACM3SM_08715 [Bacteroidota bacterium]